jgi:hypothetical protein
MGLFSFFKKKQIEISTFMMEDDYCQVEIIPVSNYHLVLKQAEDIEDFARERFDGNGFTALYQRENISNTTSQLNIKIEEFENLLNEHRFNRIKKIFYVGGDWIDYEKGVTRAYGSTLFSFWVEVRNQIVQEMWITSTEENSDERIGQIALTLQSLNKRYNLIVADWNACKIIRLDSAEEINRYLREYY